MAAFQDWIASCIEISRVILEIISLYTFTLTVHVLRKKGGVIFYRRYRKRLVSESFRITVAL